MLPDQGLQFAAKAFRAMLSRLGVNLVLSTAYHPQTDGTTERINQEIGGHYTPPPVPCGVRAE
jgi:transposase InsO family protein